MICPVCNIPMHQKDELGGGQSTDEFYETWEIKVCDICGRKMKEYYSVTLIEDGDLGLNDKDAIVIDTKLKE